jgi:hypothetical protein
MCFRAVQMAGAAAAVFIGWQAPTESVTIPLHNVTPARMVRILRQATISGTGSAVIHAIPFGTKAIVPSKDDIGLRVRGTATAVAALREVIRLLDVKQREVDIELRLVRQRYMSDGSSASEVLVAHRIRCTNNEQVDLSTESGDLRLAITLTPRINGDDTVTLLGGGSMGSEEVPNCPVTIHRRLSSNDRRALAGMTDSTNNSVQQHVREGLGITNPGACIVYYLEAIISRP